MKIIALLQLAAALYLLEGSTHVYSFQPTTLLSSRSSIRFQTHYRRSASLTNANEIDRHNNHNNSNQPKIYMKLSHASPSPLNKENADNVGDNDIEHAGTSVSMTEASIVVSNDDSKSTSIQKIAKNKIKVASAVTALFVAFSTLIACSGKGAWRYYLAGGICAAISHAITTPVDVIKVRITTFSF